ncbi:MAG: MoaD/ThiS family protein [Pseudoclavibacter caeni]|jgi:molybdopterin synthase sulfur carrier subunit
MPLRVRLFAGLREAAGAEVIVLPVSSPATVGDIRAAVAAAVPCAADAARRSACFVDGRLLRRADLVVDAATVDVLPPFAGG